MRKRRVFSYFPSEKTRKEPSVLPRLFIRGLGGSIKLDLAGVGINLSKAAFAHFLADDTLLPLHVCRGDIALIEPAVRRTHDGNLVLLELGGCPMIRQLRRQKHLWMLSSIDGSSDDLVLPANQGIQGVVIGFLRLFNKLRPVKYEGTDANYSMGFEIPARPRRQEQIALLEGARSRPRLAQCLIDAASLFSVNETSEKKKPRVNSDKHSKSKVLRPAVTALSSHTAAQNLGSPSKRTGKRKSVCAGQQGQAPSAASYDELVREAKHYRRELSRLLRENERLIRKMLRDDQAVQNIKGESPTASRTKSSTSTKHIV